MNTKDTKFAKLFLILSMCIFGTIGLVRKYIDLPSSMIALARALIGTVFLVLLLFIRRRRPSMTTIRKNLLPLLLSGAMLGFNWILLFEAYCYTSVATATLCYYMAPILMILVSPIFFREKLTIRKLLCVSAALVGMVLVSGVLQAGIGSTSELKGVFLGLGAAVFYAGVVLVNKKMKDISALDRTILQLAISAMLLLPYTLLTENWSSIVLPSTGWILLLTAGIIHTGAAYALYFGSIHRLSAQTVALYSYLDPVLAILLSALFLQEPLTIPGIIGAVLILGAAFLSESK